MIRYLTFVGLVFRFEVGILLAIILVFEWAVYRHINLKTIVTQGCLTALVSLGLSIPIDSYFWQRWVWPEGSVFFFNAILNKSSEWGTMPFHSYFTIFLPRILMISYPLALVGFVADRRLRNLLGPALIYTAVFSILPHKEWRFIMYTIPIYTIAAASVVTKLSLKARHSRYATIGLVGVAGGMLACFCGSIMMLLISMHNYPGGEALATLNNMPLESASIHLDVLTAMTGASRFGQTRPLWSYHKNESHHSVDDYLEAEYTHFISDTPLNNTPFEIISVTYGLEKVKRKSPRIYLQNLMTIFGKDWTWETFLPVEIELKPKLYTFQLPDPQKVWVDYNIQHSSVLIYSKSYCPYCKRAKEILNKYCPHQYQVVELDLRKDGRELQAALIERTGRRTVPAIFMNGKIIGGSDDLAALDNQGVLGSQLPCNPHYSKGY
ncbi:Alg9-like mannosyltransferase family-domain-containing protein [Phycomyces nitens]|nr:Alg9-like mannosyltransferase family-domain-containing protein [Phycomyces nitens]